MDEIVVEIFDLLKEIIRGDFTNLDQLPALLAVIVAAGCYLNRKQIRSFYKNQRIRIQRYTALEKLEADVKAKEAKLKAIADEIEQKIIAINEHEHLFNIKKNETLNSLNRLESALDADAEEQLRSGIAALEKEHTSSTQLVKEIREILEKVIDISVARELRANAKSSVQDVLKEVERRRKLRHSHED